MMGVVGFLVRSELRRHWRRTVGLAALVAVVGGVVTASVLGAERSRTAFERFVESTDVADVGVFVGDQAQLDPLEDVAGVAVMSRFSLLALVPEPILERDDVFMPMAASHDPVAASRVNGYRVVEGRDVDPSAADELVLHEASAAILGVGVGDRLEMAAYSPGDIEAIFESGGDLAAPSRPSVPMEVVGLIRDPADVVNRSGDIVVTPLSAAVSERYRDAVGSLGEGAFVRLEDGTSVESFVAAARGAVPDAEIERWIGGTAVEDTGFGTTLDVIGDGLLALAAVVGGAGAIAVWQGFTRTGLAIHGEDRTLAHLGLDGRTRKIARSVQGMAVAVPGAVGAGVVSLLLSSRFPIGVARRAEPEPGIDPHVGILIGSLGVLLVASAFGVLGLVVVRRPSRVVPRGWVPSWLPVGARVLGSGDGALTRSSRVAVVFGGVAITGALVFATSLGHLLNTPRLYGWSFDSGVAAQSFSAPQLRDGVDPSQDPAVAEVAQTVFQIEMDVEGAPVFGAAIGDGTGEIVPVVAEGRSPRSAREVAVGRETLRTVDKAIGDEITIDAGSGPVPFEIVGQAVLPVSTDGGRLGNGVAMVLPALDRLGLDPADPCAMGRSCFTQTAVRWEEGADLAAARRRLAAVDSPEFITPTAPPEVERLTEVQPIPWAVAGLIGALAASGTVHGIVTTVHRRRRDVAVLRALGATPRQVQRAIRAHVALIVAAASASGVVLGVAAGRTLWKGVAGSVGVAPQPVLPVLWLVLLPLAVVSLAELAAFLPAMRAARLRPTRILRAE